MPKKGGDEAWNAGWCGVALRGPVTNADYASALPSRHPPEPPVAVSGNQGIGPCGKGMNDRESQECDQPAPSTKSGQQPEKGLDPFDHLRPGLEEQCRVRGAWPISFTQQRFGFWTVVRNVAHRWTGTGGPLF